MPRARHFLLVALLFLFTSALGAEGQQPASEELLSPESVEHLARQIEALEDSLDIVRQDQLDYRLEKDLLKEVYSSNLQVVNIVVTIVLGTFAILGFLGVRSINTYKQEILAELEKIRGQRARYDEQFAEITAQTKVAQEYNVQQDRRLDILEIQEKVSALLKQEEVKRASEYVDVGLQIDPNDLILLRFKAVCFYKAARFTDAVEVAEKVLSLEPANIANAEELAELYLLTEQLDKYRALPGPNNNYLSRNEHLQWYFQAVEQYLLDDYDSLRKHVRALLANSTAGKKRQVERGWRFDELRTVFSSRESSPVKELLFKSVDFLEGGVDYEELKQLLEKKS